MRSISRGRDRSPSVALSLLACLISVILGVAVPLYPEQALPIAFLAAAALLLLACCSLYDAVLWACPLVFLFAQFQIAALDLLRWCILLLLILLSAYLLRNERPRTTPVTFGLGLVALYAIATSIQSYYPAISLEKAISLLLLAGFLLLVPPAIERLHPRLGAREYVLRMFFWIGVAIVLSNALFVLAKPSAAFLAGRYRGWFANPNGIGAVYGIFLIPVLAAEIGKHRPGLARFASICVFLLAAIELLASQSRAGIAAGIVSLAVLTLPKRGLPTRVLVIGMVGLIIAALFISAPDNDLGRRLILRNETVFEGSGRFSVWADIWQRILARPVLGSGLGVERTGSTSGELALNSVGYTIEKGNSYLGLLEELGIVGAAVVIVALLAPILKVCMRGLSRATSVGEKPDLRLVAIVLAGLTNALFEAWLLSVGSILCFSFWLFSALLLRQKSEQKAK